MSTTVNVAIPPASVVGPEIAETVMPAASLSVLLTATSAASRLLYALSVLVAGAVTIV
ncbi:hypothetical protein D3C83_244340 [compost metagenome]